jgi:hypothetical protein
MQATNFDFKERFSSPIRIGKEQFHMCSPVSGASAVQQSNATQSNPAPKAPAAPAPPSQAPDTVHLSAAALAASGDVDHDGDSH